MIKTARRGPVHRGKLDQPKGGAHAESLRVVRRVNKEITCLLLRGREPEEKGRREKHRILKRFQKDVIKLLDGLDGCIPEDNATFDALQGAAFATSDAATAYAAPLDDGVPLDVPDARAFAEHVAVAKLAAIRGLDSKAAFEAFLEHVDVVVEWRRRLAAHAQKVKKEGYTDGNGVKHTAQDVAEKAERAAAGYADPMASRLGPGGLGLQDEATNTASVRAERSRKALASQINPHRQRDAVIAAHAPGTVAPAGAGLCVGGFAVLGGIACGLPNPPTWDRGEVVQRVADYREPNGVAQLTPSEHGAYLTPLDDGFIVQPPKSLIPRKCNARNSLYCAATRSHKFSDESTAVAALEEFMAQSTSVERRREMMKVQREAYVCLYCDHKRFGRICDRVQHENRFCASRPGAAPEQSSSSGEDEL